LLLHLKGFRTLTGVMVICAVLGAALLVPGATATTLNLSVATSPKGVSGEFNYLTVFPAAVGFSVPPKLAPAGSTFLWQFGDGTNSTNATPTHVYAYPCVYHTSVRVTLPNGSVTSGGLVLGAFNVRGTPGGALAVCPPQGTGGLTQVALAGGFFAAYQSVNVAMNGTSIATVTADKGGDWVLNVSGLLASTPEPNDSRYTFTTSPPSLTRAFTTLEGVSATPGSGAPGGIVVVLGRSYPPYSAVEVYLGNLSLGLAQTDDNGSFAAGFQVPYASPLTTAGTYQYTTIPQILGSQASFTSAGSSTVVTVTSSSSWWWWLILVVVVVVAAYLAWRWMKRRRAPPFRAQPTGTPPSSKR
jgi:PKD repeat protein